MVRMFARHKVNDYGAWRNGYDASREQPWSSPIRAAAVYQAVGDPNDVTLWHDFETAEAAEAFVNSEALREAMEAAGVQGQPDIWMTEEA